MRLIKRLFAFLAFALLLGVAGCSGLTLAYNQFPFLAGLWVDNYLDLDREQERLLKTQLQAWQAWHRREELPQLVALLDQAQAAFEGGVSTDELLALERGGRASLERSLQRAAPLAAPLLASLQPAQWQHLQHRLDKKLDEWREAQSGSGGAQERADKYAKSLTLWLGSLDRATRRQARADAEGWQVDVPALAQARTVRHAQLVVALQSWARQDYARGTTLLMRNTLAQPVEKPYQDQILASVQKVLNGMNAEQRDSVRKHWADWKDELQKLQATDNS